MLILHLTPELGQRLIQEAKRQSLDTDAYVMQLIEKHLPPQRRDEALVDLVQSWMDDDDASEQQETGEYLIRVLDQDRLSERQLFPPELKGITW